MTVHRRPTEPRRIHRSLSHQATTSAYCLMCQAEHRWADCPLTPEQRAEIGRRRMARGGAARG